MSTENLFLQINRPQDSDNLSPIEQKHVPQITTPDKIKAGEPFTLEVKVGSIQHPMENDHHIQFLDLYIDEVYLTRLTFIPVVLQPQASLRIILKHSGKLRAVSRCNLHGQWEGSVDLKVEEEAPPKNL